MWLRKNMMQLNSISLRLVYLLNLLILFICNSSAQSDKISVYDDFESFESDYINWKSDTTLILNFWATWCKPCVQELPYFEELHRLKLDFPHKVVLVSLDKKSDLDPRLKSFLNKRNITSRVILLSAPEAHIWIDKVDNSWSGAIPATVIIRNNKKEFYEKEFENFDELMSLVNKFINQQ
jgi:thiol-disulfide isomerase/thioredoxin